MKKGNNMEKMPRNQIEEIGKDILSRTDIIAQHGTSIANAKSIMETGFNFTRTSYVINSKKDLILLCTYGWKENFKGDAANVIMCLPKSFFIQLIGFDNSAYSMWIDNALRQNQQAQLLDSITYFDFSSSVNKDDMVMRGYKGTIPREFVKGCFIYTDNTNYLSFFPDNNAGMDHLTYIENPNYFENLSKDDQALFVEEMRNKIFGNYNNLDDEPEISKR